MPIIPKQLSVALTVDGRTYTLRPSELTSLDASALRRATGMSIAGVLGAVNSDPDLDIVAALVWLARRTAGEENLAYEDVARAITYSSDIAPVDAEPDDEADFPEA